MVGGGDVGTYRSDKPSYHGDEEGEDGDQRACLTEPPEDPRQRGTLFPLPVQLLMPQRLQPAQEKHTRHRQDVRKTRKNERTKERRYKVEMIYKMYLNFLFSHESVVVIFTQHVISCCNLSHISC